MRAPFGAGWACCASAMRALTAGGGFDPFREPLVLARHAVDSVDHEEGDIGGVDGPERAYQRVVLGAVVDPALPTHACGVDETDRAFRRVDHRVDRVARRARQI